MLNDIYEFIFSDSRTVGAVLTIVLVGFLVYLLFRKGLNILAERGALAGPLVRLFRLFLRWTFVSLITLFVLQELGVLQNVWTALLAVMAMVAIGFFAMWSILSNVLCTFLILLYRPFRIGDVVKIPTDNLQGKVVDLNLMFTTLEGEGKELIQVPNNQFFQKAICCIQTEDSQISLYEQLIQLRNGHNKRQEE